MKVEKFWNERVEKYGKLSTGYTERILYEFDNKLRFHVFLKNTIIRKKYKILDVGCNFGPWLGQLYKRGYHNLAGCDISSKSLKIAKQIFKKNNYNISLQVNPAEKFKFNEKYDLIYCVTVLQHILDDKKFETALGNFSKHLKPNGKVVIIESSPTFKKKQKLEYKKERTFKRQVQLFESNGFKLIDYKGINFLSYYSFHIINLGPISENLKRKIQKIAFRMLFPIEMFLSRHKIFAKGADLKFMMYKKIK